MKRYYYCPKCNATLNPNVKIILTAVKDMSRGLVLFSPQPGNYQMIASDDFSFSPGDMIKFLCPVCSANLDSEVDSNLAEIHFRYTDGAQGQVFFSKRFGEQATIFVSEEWVRSYGANAAAYETLNFFGEGIEKDT